MQHIRFISILLLWLGTTGLQAQEATIAAGGDASGTGGSTSYTVGQVVYFTNAGTNGSAAQGVQLPFEISVVSGNEDGAAVSLSYSVYPNPTVGFITLIFEVCPLDDMRYHLYDIQGKLLESRILTASQTEISMSAYMPSVYLLKVIHNNKEVRTFKIIKK